MVFEDIVERFCKIVGVNTVVETLSIYVRPELHVITNNMHYHYYSYTILTGGIQKKGLQLSHSFSK